jgi:hypothetical protein
MRIMLPDRVLLSYPPIERRKRLKRICAQFLEGFTTSMCSFVSTVHDDDMIVTMMMFTVHHI